MRRIAFLFVSICYFTACNNEMIDNQANPIDKPKSQIELFLPDAQTVSLYSTAAPRENTIDTIWVIAFNGSTKQWVEKIPGTDIVRNGEAFQLLPQLTHIPQTGWNGWKFVCIANVDPNPDTSTVNLTPTNINNCFKLDVNNYYNGDEHLPMYGEFIWSSSGGYTCVMERAVAKIQVQLGTSVSDVTGNFTADNVVYSVRNAGNAGYIQPTTPMLGYPSTGWVTSADRYLLQKSSVTEKDLNLYLYEYPSATKTGLNGNVLDTDFDPARQHIILRKTNPSMTDTYFRLDFYDPIAKKYMDTKRNHHYLFTINKVRSEGYTSLGQAQNNPGSNIEYTIEKVDGTTRIATNGQYAIVATGGLDTLNFIAPTYNAPYTVLSARIYLPTQMTSGLASGTINTIAVQEVSGAYPGAFSISPAALPTPPTSLTPIQVSVSSGTPTGTIGVITFRLGNITHRVYFKYSPS